MVRIYHTINNKIKQVDHIVPGCWVALTNPSANEILQISKDHQIDVDDMKAALDKEERARVEEEDGYTLILVDSPTVEISNEKEWYVTVPLSIIFTKDLIFTVCLNDTPILHPFMDGTVKEFSTYKKTRFILQILYNNASTYLRYLRVINHKSESVDKRLQKAPKDSDLFEVYELEKCLVYFTTALRANEVVLERMLKHDLIRQYPEDEDLLEDVIVENKQAIEMTDIYRNILNVTMSLFASIIDNNLNRVMKFLASVTVVLSIPTMISGFYGMNVNLSGMPFASSPYAFPSLALFCVVTCIIVLFVLKKKGLL